MLSRTALRRIVRFQPKAARSTKLWHQARSFPRMCLSTAPRRSYDEAWGVERTDWRASPTSRPRWQTPATPRSRKPFSYNSLVKFPEKLTMRWPPRDHAVQSNDVFKLNCLDFAIAKPGKGGHVVLGRNGSGKSLLVEYLAHPERFVQGQDDIVDTDQCKLIHNDQVAYVSFDSHWQVLKDRPHWTVHDFITNGSGNLTKAARYLTVRFGLFPLLHRTLSTLSTGEIRKCLLVGALAQEPRLLLLENAFDGLDVTARAELQSIVSKTIQGLDQSGKLLVQHVNPEYVPHAQVVLSTHRPQEIVPEIATVSWMDHYLSTNNVAGKEQQHDLVTMPRPVGLSQEQIMYLALGLNKDHNKSTNWSVLEPWQEENPTLPSLQDIRQVWDDSSSSTDSTPDTLLSLQDVEIRRRRDGECRDEEENSEFATLLNSLCWSIDKGERWLIAGGNGAGKSTLSRFLLQQKAVYDEEEEEDINSSTHDWISGVYSKDPNTTIGWVSTESHLGQVDSTDTAWSVICHKGDVPESVAETMVQWVFGDVDANNVLTTLQNRSLEELSQGEQKLCLIASALALRPNLLVLDEATQGLDWVNRRRVLALLERICQAQEDQLSLVYITHYEEEWIPSISHVLHLDSGRALFQGPKSGYKKDKL